MQDSVECLAQAVWNWQIISNFTTVKFFLVKYIDIRDGAHLPLQRQIAFL